MGASSEPSGVSVSKEVRPLSSAPTPPIAALITRTLRSGAPVGVGCHEPGRAKQADTHKTKRTPKKKKKNETRERAVVLEPRGGGGEDSDSWQKTNHDSRKKHTHTRLATKKSHPSCQNKIMIRDAEINRDIQRNTLREKTSGNKTKQNKPVSI